MSKYTGTSTLENMGQASFYNSWTLKKFDKFLKGEILEVGCGIGNFTGILADFGKVTAIDIDESLIKKFDTEITKKVKAGFGDIEKGEYFFGKKTFDTIVCINVLEHIENDNKALENMYSLLKPDGFLILLVPINKFLYGKIDESIGHYRRYNPKDLEKEMVTLGYEINSKKILNFIGAIGWVVSGRILKNNQITENKIKLFNLVSPLLYLENFIKTPIGTSVLIIAKKK